MPDENGYTLEDMERWKQKALDNIETLKRGIEREQVQVEFADKIITDLQAKETASELSE